MLSFATLGGCAGAAPAPTTALPAETAGLLPVTVSTAEGSVALTGVLMLPEATRPSPAVILMHGCSGVSPTMRQWATVLRGWGYASFVLDSFKGRGLTSVCESGALRSEDRVDDAHAALRLLARHPRIDPERVALMGFSHGGGVVVLAASRWVARRYSQAGAPAFRAFVAFYPRCAGRYPGTLAAPLRVHIGALDDWTPGPPCEEMVDALRQRGADARITVYPDARHAFDAAALPAERWLANVQGPHGRRGATIGHNAEATRRAHANVRQELAELLGG
ncbi:MAG TPA: dienelactone hydrolase family protein [Methylomirabilota bacterium]|nr:dienelactone hydrolase family protein [Methylomirabilota bacterium]